MIASQPSRLRAPSSQTIRGSVLVIVRDLLQQQRLTECLASEHTVYFVRNNTEMTALLANERIDLVLIDNRSSDPDGARLCAWLKASPNHSPLPVVMLIPARRPALRIECLDSGADAVLETSFSRSHIRAQVRNLILNRTRLKRYYAQASSQPVAPDPSQPAAPGSAASADGEFAVRLHKLIEENLSNPKLDIPFLARQLNMSRATFYRQMKTLGEGSPNEQITAARLKKAAKLIAGTGHSIAGICNMVGFHSRSNFGKAFYRQYGLTPTDYKAKVRNASSR